MLEYKDFTSKGEMLIPHSTNCTCVILLITNFLLPLRSPPLDESCDYLHRRRYHLSRVGVYSAFPK